MAGLLLVGDLVRHLDARAESEAAVKKIGADPKEPHHSSWAVVVPWIISMLSVVALIIVIVATA